MRVKNIITCIFILLVVIGLYSYFPRLMSLLFALSVLWIGVKSNLLARFSLWWKQRRFDVYGQMLEKKMTELLRNADDFLEQSHQRVKDYIERKREIEKRLLEKELEVEILKEKLTASKDGEVVNKLQKEMSKKSAELDNIRNEYIRTIEESKQAEAKVKKLEVSRQKLREERTQLLKKLEEWEKACHRNEEKNQQLENELAGLKAEVENKQKEIKRLLTHADSSKQLEILQVEKTHLEKLITERKAEQVELKKRQERAEKAKSELEQELESKEKKLHEAIEQLEQSRVREDFAKQQLQLQKQEISKIEYYLTEQARQIEDMTVQLRQRERSEDQLKAQLERALDEKENIEKEKNENDQLLLLFEEDVKKKQNEVGDLQNQITMLQYEKDHKYEESQKLTNEQKHTLEKEYEPRFKHLYSKATFSAEFFQDFFNLHVQERIKVESKIAMLHYQPDAIKNSLRPHTVHTKLGAVLELTFSDTGRIYYKHHKNQFLIYRISGGNHSKSDQERIIRWIERNVEQLVEG